MIEICPTEQGPIKLISVLFQNCKTSTPGVVQIKDSTIQAMFVSFVECSFTEVAARNSRGTSTIFHYDSDGFIANVCCSKCRGSGGFSVMYSHHIAMDNIMVVHPAEYQTVATCFHVRSGSVQNMNSTLANTQWYGNGLCMNPGPLKSKFVRTTESTSDETLIDYHNLLNGGTVSHYDYVDCTAPSYIHHFYVDNDDHEIVASNFYFTRCDPVYVVILSGTVIFENFYGERESDGEFIYLTSFPNSLFHVDVKCHSTAQRKTMFVQVKCFVMCFLMAL